MVPSTMKWQRAHECMDECGQWTSSSRCLHCDRDFASKNTHTQSKRIPTKKPKVNTSRGQEKGFFILLHFFNLLKWARIGFRNISNQIYGQAKGVGTNASSPCVPATQFKKKTATQLSLHSVPPSTLEPKMGEDDIIIIRLNGRMDGKAATTAPGTLKILNLVSLPQLPE